MQKLSIVIVYTGDGKGKTSAAIGLSARALGAGKKVAFVQFIKSWEVSEHKFFAKIAPLFNAGLSNVVSRHPEPTLSSRAQPRDLNSGLNSKEVAESDAFSDWIPGQARNDNLESYEKFTFYKGGKGFFNAGESSAKNRKTGEKISELEHENAARQTFDFAIECAISGNFDLVICDEINNAVSDGLLKIADLEKLIKGRNPKTSLCLTGRNWPTKLNDLVDIITEMKKLKHHFDDGFLAEEGIDY